MLLRRIFHIKFVIAWETTLFCGKGLPKVSCNSMDSSFLARIYKGNHKYIEKYVFYEHFSLLFYCIFSVSSTHFGKIPSPGFSFIMILFSKNCGPPR